jgi:hypothetical protein
LVLWPHRRLWAHLTAVAAYLSKEIAVTLPATVFLLDLALGHVSLRRPRLRALVTRYGVFLAIWLGYLAFLWWRFPNVSRFAAELGSGPTFGTSEVANVALPARMLNIVTLVVLTPFQSWIRVDRLSGILTALLGVGVLVGIASVLSRWSWPDEPVTRQRAARLIPLGLIWIVVTSAPILKASGFAFYRMGTLVSVGASLCALAVLYRVFGPEARRLRKVVGLTLFLSWLGALWVESVQGSLDLDPYSRHMVEVNAYEYRAWSPYMPRATVRALQLRASGRQDHTWPIYRRDPPETYGETVSAP